MGCCDIRLGLLSQTEGQLKRRRFHNGMTEKRQRHHSSATSRPNPAEAPPSLIEQDPDDDGLADRLLSAALQFLTLANDLDNEGDTLSSFVAVIKSVTRCAAVGIRVEKGGSALVYGADDGFCEAFMEAEGALDLDNDHCLCLSVFHQRCDTSLPFFTDQGSFYTNDTQIFLELPEISQLGELRGTCCKEYFRTLGIFPVRSRQTVLGLIQVADPRPDQLPRQMVALLEKAAFQLGTNIERIRALQALEASHEALEERVKRSTAELAETNTQLKQQIEQRRAADHRLTENQYMLQRVFDGISDPLVLLDQDVQVQMLNTAAKQYYGVDNPQAVLNRACFDGLGQFRPPCQFCRIPASVKAGHQLEFERQGFLEKDRNEEVRIYPLKHRDGAPRGAVMQIRDVTESTVMKSQLNAIQQQAALGLLVSSVAHEIKNPNSFIALNISILRDYLNDIVPILDTYATGRPDFEICRMPYAEFRDDVFKLMDTIEHGSQRIDAYLRNLREYSEARTRIELQPVSIAPIIEKILSLAGNKIRQMVKTFKADVPEELPEIDSDPVVLEQVLVNLLINAAQSADKGDSWVRFHILPVNAGAKSIVMKVEDNGCGMDAQTLKKIFEPFFSTKIAEGGTGLGLYVCRNLISQLGGELQVTSELGVGSCFTIELPLQKR
jgi:signal transduction histidine kinase/DNA-binding transcriptional MerR regulator